MTTHLELFPPGVLAVVAIFWVLLLRHLFIEFMSDTRDKRKRR